MDPVLLVSLFNAGILSVAIVGCMLFYRTPAYHGVCLLLTLVIIASIANILEDQHISRDWHLISPIFVLGYGPALYLAVKRLIVEPIGYRALWHFVPMLLLLPFTAHAQSIIAVGTVWRIVYALLTLQLIIGFNRQLTQQRSDAAEVSLAWLGWLIGLSTLFSALDLLRLNVQPELGAQLNMMAYAANAFIFLLVLLLLLAILSHKQTGLQTITGAIFDGSAAMPDQAISRSEETAADYQSLFASLDHNIRQHSWYCQPRLSLSQLSELSGMATRDISRSINLVAEVSFNDYINQHRIEHIKRSLHTDKSTNLTKLAFSAGFSSKATFNQSFKKATNMTPSEFRSSLPA
ncbi:MAG: helix-turn-helix domain-containing protein [Alkalimonas sp.]|nr:helix-turn-helix domain-containing protein [Alkalimonas sp.]